MLSFLCRFKPPEIPSDWTPNPLKILIRVDLLSQDKEKIIPKDADDVSSYNNNSNKVS